MSNEKYGLVLDTSFIGGGLKQPGTVLPNYAGPFGAAIKPCDASGKLIEEAAEDAGDDLPALFAAKHVSRGDYVVEKIEDGSRASVVFKNTGTKGEAEQQAQAEADRLNRGGELILDTTEAPPAPPLETGDDLPDA